MVEYFLILPAAGLRRTLQGPVWQEGYIYTVIMLSFATAPLEAPYNDFISIIDTISSSLSSLRGRLFKGVVFHECGEYAP